MAPRTGSRQSFALGVPDERGRRFLSEREPYRFREHTDTRVHVVARGDTLEGLAGRYTHDSRLLGMYVDAWLRNASVTIEEAKKRRAYLEGLNPGTRDAVVASDDRGS